MGFLLRLILNGVAIWLAAWLLDGVRLTLGSFPGEHALLTQGNPVAEQVITVAVVALVFTLVSTLIKPVVKLLALPLTILTLGLFTLVINALMVMLTSWITGFVQWGITVDGFWSAFLAGLIISVVTWLLNALLPGDR